jgi:hypothetical protein
LHHVNLGFQISAFFRVSVLGLRISALRTLPSLQETGISRSAVRRRINIFTALLFLAGGIGYLGSDC